MKQIKANLTPQQYDTLMKINNETGLSLSEIIRRAFDSYTSTQNVLSKRQGVRAYK